jgi:hypothetical protein
MSCLQRRKYKQYELLEWSTNNVLQLQRLAYEEMGFGTWSRGDELIPVTKEGELLAALDIADESHPRLRARTPPVDLDAQKEESSSSLPEQAHIEDAESRAEPSLSESTR